MPATDYRLNVYHNTRINLGTNTRFRSNDTGLLYGGYGARIRRISTAGRFAMVALLGVLCVCDVCLGINGFQ